MHKTFYTSDNHFFHENIIRYCNRPFKDVGEMNSEMIRRWNSVVSEGDLVYVLGDFSFGKVPQTKTILNQLKGRKILIMGNHDKKSVEAMREAGFEHVVAMEQRETLGVLFGQEELSPILVKMSHFPYKASAWDTFKTWFKIKFLQRRKKHYRTFDEFRPTKTASMPHLLHGHVHEAWLVKDCMVNVGVDVHNFYPVPSYVLHKLIMTGYIDRSEYAPA